MKKNLILFVILLCTFSLQSQNLVSSTDAVIVLEAEKSSDLSTLEGINPQSDTYIQLKLQVEAYDLMSRHLDGNEDVLYALRTTVVEIRPGATLTIMI